MYRRKKDLLRFVRSGQPMTVRQQVYLAAQLSIPSIFAQISSVIMQYIDASMVGSLGANASASIGLVSTTTWLFMGLCTSVAAGFAVQVAHLLGAKDADSARCDGIFYDLRPFTACTPTQYAGRQYVALQW